MKEYSKLFKTIKEDDGWVLLEVCTFDVCPQYNRTRVMRHRFKIIGDESRIIQLAEIMTLNMDISHVAALMLFKGGYSIAFKCRHHQADELMKRYDYFNTHETYFNDGVLTAGSDHWGIDGCAMYDRATGLSLNSNGSIKSLNRMQPFRGCNNICEIIKETGGDKLGSISSSFLPIA